MLRLNWRLKLDKLLNPQAKPISLIEYFENGTLELFDLKNDLGEQHDISKEKPETTQKMLKMLKILQDRRQVRTLRCTPD